MSNHEAGGSAAELGGAPPTNKAGAPGIVARLASVRLTLWLLGILAVAMAVATIIPQKAPDEVYERAFGTLFGPLITQTTLRNVYGAWWFIGAFALLAASLGACSVRRILQSLRSGRSAEGQVTPERVAASQHRDRWQSPRSVEETAAAVTAALRDRGYGVTAAPTTDEDQRGLVGNRGRLAGWAPTVIHIGMILVLAGAAYGRLPSNTYRLVASLAPGESFPVESGKAAFSVRLLEAGSERDSEGRPTRFWARAEILEDGEVVKSKVIEPNHPLRHRGVSVVLQSLPQAGYAVEVAQEETLELVPVVFTHEGAVDMMGTVRRLERPPWIVFIHDFQPGAHGTEGPSARVFIDQSGELSQNWETVGWVNHEGVEYGGLHFRLVSSAQGAQLSLDRDIGVPIVWLGFGVAVLGAILLISVVRSRVIVLVRAKGSGSQVMIGGSGPRVERDLQTALSHVETELGGQLGADKS